MINFNSKALVVLMLLGSLVWLPKRVHAQFSVLTNETLVNSTTAGDQWGYWWSVRTIAVQPDGGYIIAFIDLNGLDGSAEGIFARLFNADGTPKGPQFLVNTTTVGQQYSPTVAVAPDGSFIIGWEGPGSSIDAWGQKYTEDGVKVGSEFILSTTVGGSQRYPEIQFFLDGSWVAGFVDGGQTVLQKFDALNRPFGLETRISSGTGDVVMDGLCVRPDGTLLITWTSGQDVYGQIFTSSLQPIGTQTRLNTYTAGNQEYAIARVDGAGNFVVVWESDGQDGSGMGMYGRRFDKDFNPLSGEFQITTNTTNDQFEPQIMMNPNGRFVIVWSDNNNRDGGGGSPLLPGPGASVWMREYAANGTPVGVETMVNQSITGYQAYPVTDMNASGRFVVSWEGNGTQAGQVDDYGIFVRAYQLSQTGTTALSVTPTNTVASDVVTVTMTLTNPTNLTDVKPNPLSISATNEVFATLLTGPTPASQSVGTTPATYTWTYQITARDSEGVLSFGGNAYTDAGNIFPFAESNEITVKPAIFLSDLTAPNLIGDSNNPATDGPKVFTIGAKLTNSGLNDLTEVTIFLGDGTTPGVFPVTTMTLAQTNNTYQGSFALVPLSGAAGCTRPLITLGFAQPAINGGIDFNRDGLVNGSDDGTLNNGKIVIDGRVDVNNSGTVTLSDDLPRPPGIFYGWREPAIIDGYVDMNGDGVINSSDDGTYGGETRNIYWQVQYTPVDASGQPTFGSCGDFVDDLRYDWKIWVTAFDAGVSRTDVVDEYAKVRCEQSAATNKIAPAGGWISSGPPRVITGIIDLNADGVVNNSDDGVYYAKTIINGYVDMNNDGSISTADDGVLNSFPVIDGRMDTNNSGTITTADDAVLVQPGQTFSITLNNADFGSIGAGFDENRDGIPDYDAWYQPVGETTWPSTSFRLVDIQADVVGTGGTSFPSTHYDNEPYFSQLLGATGGSFEATYTYSFLALAPGTGFLTPYQQTGSGTNNEKYNGDYDAGVQVLTGLPGLTLSKASNPANTVKTCDEITWTLSYTNTATTAAGDPGSGNGVVIEDAIPAALAYVAGSVAYGTYLGTTYYSTDNGATWSSTPPPASSINRIRCHIDVSVPSGGAGTVNFRTVFRNCPAHNTVITNNSEIKLGTGAPIATAADIVTVSNVGPVITCPGPVTVSCAGSVPVAATDLASFLALGNGATATDDCPGLTVTHLSDVISNLTCPNRYTVTRTYLATDACTNTASCTQVISVDDQTAPTVATCPGNISVPIGPGICGAIVNYALPTFNDNCSGAGLTGTLMAGLPPGSTFPPGSTTTITYTYTDPCGNGPVICSFTVTVDAPPTVSISETDASCTANDGIVISGEAAILTATSGFSSYSWDNGLGTGNPKTVNPISTTTYNVTATDANGCTATAANTVTVISAPTVSASNTGPYCSGSTVMLNATGGTGYNWTGPNGFSSSSQNPTIPSATIVANGIYTVTVTDTNNCTATATTTVVVNSLPTAGLTKSGDLSCVVTSVTLTATPATGVTYTWSAGATPVPATNTATVVSSGAYTVTITDTSSGCTSTSAVNVNFNVCPIVAEDDNLPPTGGSVLGNDTFNGNPATTAETDVTPNTNGPLTIDADGDVTVAPNTPPGIYTIPYELCETGAIPANCDTAVASLEILCEAKAPVLTKK